MTRDDVIRMAREAGLQEVVEKTDHHTIVKMMDVPALERFAALVAEEVRGQTIESEKRGWLHAIDKMVAAEREACAKVCDEQSQLQLDERVMRGIDVCAAAIRARGEKQ